MNSPGWRQDVAQAHDAQAAAIEVAEASLDALDGALEPLTAARVADTLTALAQDRARHERDALLARGRS